jgi:hypothetical protein
MTSWSSRAWCDFWHYDLMSKITRITSDTQAITYRYRYHYHLSPQDEKMTIDRLSSTVCEKPGRALSCSVLSPLHSLDVADHKSDTATGPILGRLAPSWQRPASSHQMSIPMGREVLVLHHHNNCRYCFMFTERPNPNRFHEAHCKHYCTMGERVS